MEDKINEDDIINLISLNKETTTNVRDIVNANNIEETQRLIKLFNLSQTKKNVIRVMKLNELLDSVQDTMIDRFKAHPDEFTNKDLLDYFQVAQSAIDRANKSINMISDTPAIQINNITMTESPNNEQPVLNRESRDKVLNFIDDFMKSLNKVQDEIVIEEGVSTPEMVSSENTFNLLNEGDENNETNN